MYYCPFLLVSWPDVPLPIPVSVLTNVVSFFTSDVVLPCAVPLLTSTDVKMAGAPTHDI